MLSVNGALPTGIAASAYDPLTGILRLTGEASHDAYEAAIRQMEFSTTQPLGTQKRIDVIVFDGEEWGPEAKAFITVGECLGSTAAPVLDLDANNSNGVVGADDTATYTAGGPAIPVADIDVSITDADSADDRIGDDHDTGLSPQPGRHALRRRLAAVPASRHRPTIPSPASSRSAARRRSPTIRPRCAKWSSAARTPHLPLLTAASR